MGWPIIGGGGSGGGGGSSSGTPASGTTGEVAPGSTEDIDIDVDGLVAGDMPYCKLTQVSGSSTACAVQILDSAGDSISWALGSGFSSVDPTNPLVGPRMNSMGTDLGMPMLLRSTSEQAHFRIYNRDYGQAGTFKLDIVARPVTTA